MNPKKSKELISITASELGKSETLVKDITDFYWEHMRKSLSELKKSRIYVAGMGMFVIAPKKLACTKEKYKFIIEKMSTDTFNKYSNKKELENRLVNIEKVFDEITENVERKKQLRLIRQNENNNQNLEE